MAETIMRTEHSEVTLIRPHTPAASPLRAWSAADQLVIDHLLTGEDLGRVLIVNDDFGALTCALASTHPVVWTDSALSRVAIDHNLRANDHEPLTSEQSVPGDQHPTDHFDTVIIRVPKTIALLQHQLSVVGSVTSPESTVVGAGMARHIHSSTVELFEAIVGPTTTSRAVRKARLIHATPGGEPMTPQLVTSEFKTESGLRVAELPGTFSAGHLDVGSALLLDVLASQPSPADEPVVADLGCGNGILAAEMTLRWPAATFLLLDVSDLAVAAATKTWQLNELGDGMQAEAADGFSTTPTDSIDVVISNPPFHHGHALDPDLTDWLMADMARVLCPGGVAYLVAQRHLHMHTRLCQWFSTVEVLSKHPSHVVIKVS